MTTIITILQALIALPKIGELIKSLVVALIAWRKDVAKAAMRKQIEDVSIEHKKAKTKEERRAVLKKWHDILSD